MGQGPPGRSSGWHPWPRGIVPCHRRDRGRRLMLRIGFLPSDFNPMMLMLGEAEDLHRLAATLRGFAREPADAPLDASCVRLAASDGPLGIHPANDDNGAFLWRLDRAHAQY